MEIIEKTKNDWKALPALAVATFSTIMWIALFPLILFWVMTYSADIVNDVMNKLSDSMISLNSIWIAYPIYLTILFLTYSALAFPHVTIFHIWRCYNQKKFFSMLCCNLIPVISSMILSAILFSIYVIVEFFHLA